MADPPALQRLRKVCLALPETEEIETWGHPTFRVGKKGFAAFETVKGRPSIAFRVDPLDLPPGIDATFETPYGRGQWYSVWADGAVDWRILKPVLQRSYDLARPKKRK